LEGIWKKQHSLQEFLDPKHFKSYEELKSKLEQVLSASGASISRADEVDLQEQKPSKPATAVKRKNNDINLDDEDESLSYFAKLANED